MSSCRSKRNVSRNEKIIRELTIHKGEMKGDRNHRMIVDEAYRPYIKRFQIILSPSTGQNTKATVCSYGDELTFTFSSLLKDTSVQKVFFRSLAEDGIDVEIETNGVYYD